MNERESAALKMLSKDTGKYRSEIVRKAIRNQTFRARLTLLRAKVVPRDRAAGWLPRVHEIAQDELRRLRLAIEEQRRCLIE